MKKQEERIRLTKKKRQIENSLMRDEYIRETIMRISYLLNRTISYLQRITKDILTVDKPYCTATDLQRYYTRRLLAEDVPFKIAWTDMREKYLKPALRIIDEDLLTKANITFLNQKTYLQHSRICPVLREAEKCKKKR